MNDAQVKERQKLNDEYIAKFGKTLTKRYTKEAGRSKEVKEDLRKAAIAWERNELSAKEREEEKQKIIDDYVASKLKAKANSRSKVAILTKYKKDGKYTLKKSE